jgi:hypothetical protein
VTPTPRSDDWPQPDPADDDYLTYPDTPTIYETDPHVVAVIYGPTGHIISEQYDRPSNPIGFTRQTDRPTNWSRR